MNLLIVESPGKIKKIQGFLGPEYMVEASYGHVRDLPEKEMGVAAPDFKPKYVPSGQGRKRLAELAAAVKKAGTVYLATDPDREGEAIAWHLQDALKLSSPHRVTFQEITETAVKAAMANPRTIDMQLVKAQEARRVLDRLVGYLVSPALSNAAGSHVSAGRVQSPALRLVAEREAAIRDFKVTSHFGVELTFESVDNASGGWPARWNPKNWLEEGQEYFLDQEAAEKIAALRRFTVTAYQETESRQAPPAPFTTSTLQQAASNALKFNPKRTMELAQKLYESSCITYMRTDSPNLSEEAITDIRSLAAKNDWPVPTKPRTWKSKDGAQEAHEAVRPVHVEIEEAGANDDEKALYRLIRFRALASQLEEAVYSVTSATLEAELDGKKVVFEARGRRLLKPGWRLVLSGDQTDDPEEEKETGGELPKLREGGEAVASSGKVLAQKTRPPARFTEAALVKKLEDLGIGRPSTFAAILEGLSEKGYVKTEKRQLVPTAAGESLIAALNGKFDFLNFAFTREMEAKLDDIAQGKAEYQAVVTAAHDLLQTELQTFARAHGHVCPECGKPLRRLARAATGGDKGYDFWGCTGYPECKASFLNKGGKPGEQQVKKEPVPLSEHKCPDCGKSLRHMVKKGDGGYDFWGCSGYPECKSTFKDDGGRPGFNPKSGAK